MGEQETTNYGRREKLRGNRQEAGKAQVEREEKIFVLFFAELLGKKFSRDSRPGVLNVAQCWQSCV